MWCGACILNEVSLESARPRAKKPNICTEIGAGRVTASECAGSRDQLGGVGGMRGEFSGEGEIKNANESNAH